MLLYPTASKLSICLSSAGKWISFCGQSSRNEMLTFHVHLSRGASKSHLARDFTNSTTSVLVTPHVIGTKMRSGFDSRRYRIFREVVGLERGSLSLVSTTEELLERNSSGSGLENREYGRTDPSR
jgi:hypothetical protein